MSLLIKNQSVDLAANLEQSYDFLFNNKIAEFSSDFAEAIEARSKQAKTSEEKFYALVFKKDFPVDLDRLNILRDTKDKTVQELVDFGKIKNPQGKEILVAVLKKPEGVSLKKYIADGGVLNDNIATTTVLNQLFVGLITLHENHLTHGSINLDNIYINPKDFAVTIKESISEYCGFSQRAAYETYERIVCHPAGKNYLDSSADYYALGMVMVSLVTGEELFSGFPDDIVAKIKFENGSFDSAIGIINTRKNIKLSTKNENLLKGLLHDKISDRWGSDSIKKWQKKEMSQVVPSRVHRQTSASFTFENQEYTSAKYLAYAIQKNWSIAKKNLKIPDLSRWITFTSKFPDIEKRIFLMTHGWQNEVIIPDEKISRILNLLDEDGPIRMRGTCFHPRATGNIFVHFMNEGNQEGIEDILAVFDLGLIEGWISQQDDAEMYKSTILGWNPRKIKSYLRRKESGFGVERCAYELNFYLPCRSPLLDSFYCNSLAALLKDIEKTKLGTVSPSDKHLFAYLATYCGIEDTIKIKSLSHFPELANNEEIKLSVLFSLAQKVIDAQSLPNLTRWVRERMEVVLRKIYSNKIRTSIEEKLNKAVASGDINKLFSIIADTKLLRKDFNGFRNAKNQYKLLSFEIFRLRSRSNLDQMSYKLGLRAALMFSYLVSTVTMLTVLLLTMKQ